MHKEELIELHQIFYDIKEYFESINPDLKFPQYTALKIHPDQVNRSKLETNTQFLSSALSLLHP